MITQERLKELLHYDPLMGELIWKSAVSGRARANTIAGTIISPLGYRSICIDRERYLAHRLIWLYHTGEHPTYNIDHIDGNPKNNNIHNLREATQSQNMHNMKLRKDNISGVKGLHWVNYYQYWLASIELNGIKYRKFSKDKQVCIDWLIEMRPKLHNDFSNNG